MAKDDLAARVAALEETVAGLVAHRTAAAAVPVEGDYYALLGLRERAGDEGGVVFAGSAPLPSGERVEWQWGRPTGYLFGDEAVDWADLVPALAALGPSGAAAPAAPGARRGAQHRGARRRRGARHHRPALPPPAPARGHRLAALDRARPVRRAGGAGGAAAGDPDRGATLKGARP